MKVLELPAHIESVRRQACVADDFFSYTSGQLWTTIATDSGTVAVNDEAGGVITLSPSDVTVADNDEVYIHTTKEVLNFQSEKAFVIEGRFSFAEAATDDANFIFGALTAPAANALQDNGAGPPANYNGALFFKEDGQTVLSVENSITTTQKTTQLTADNSYNKTAQTFGMSGFQRLRIEFRPTTSAKCDIVFWRDSGSGFELVRVHKDQSYSASELAIIAGMKNGGGTQDTFEIDYILWALLR